MATVVLSFVSKSMKTKPFLRVTAFLFFAGFATVSLLGLDFPDVDDSLSLERLFMCNAGNAFFDAKGRLPLTTDELVLFGKNEISSAKYKDLKIISTYRMTFEWYSEQEGKIKTIALHWMTLNPKSFTHWAVVPCHGNDKPTPEMARLCAAMQRFWDETGRIPMTMEKLLEFDVGGMVAFIEENGYSSLSLASYKNLKRKFLFPTRFRFDWYSEADAKDTFCVLTASPSKLERDEREHTGSITDSLFEFTDANQDLPEEKTLCDAGRSFFNGKGRLPLTAEEFLAFGKNQLSPSVYKGLKLTSDYSISFDWYSEQSEKSEGTHFGFSPETKSKPLP